MVLFTIVLCWVLMPEKQATNGRELNVNVAQGPQGFQWQDLKRNAGTHFTGPLLQGMGSSQHVAAFNSWLACTKELMVSMYDRKTFYVYTSIHAP